MYKLATLILILSLPAACKVNPRNYELAEFAPTPSAAKPEPKNRIFVDLTGEELLPEPISQIGTCNEDIYTSWFVEQYKASHPFKGKSKSSKQTWEKEALAYAMSRLANSDIGEKTSSLPVANEPEVDRWIRFFKASDRSTFLKWLSVGESVEHLILPELARYGVPKEFYYLAMIESGFNSKAKSMASAAGTWQFMSGTAKLYGLRVDRFVDERKDPLKSSRAAAQLLKDLYSQFGDWYLAMAAYNAGPGRVEKAIKLGKTRDFWALARGRYLPKETAEYVPRWIAAFKVGSERAKHGFYLSDETENLVPNSSVTLSKAYSIHELAKALGVSESTLNHWNPELLKGITPPLAKGKTYELRLEDQMAKKLTVSLTTLPFLDIKETMEYHVRPGDTLNAIAKRHGVSLAEIHKLNPGIKPSALKIGRGVLLPAG
ncbi:MAG: transglycosylase SLT domain-containing protein [Pseudomonadota bacterium]